MSIEEKLVTIADNQSKIYHKGYEDMAMNYWKMITSNGTRKNYTRAFYSTNYGGFSFPKPIKATSSSMYMFYDYKGSTLPGNIDLSEADVSGTWEATTTYNLFGWGGAYLKSIYDMGLPAPDEYRQTFQYCYALTKIEKVRVKKETSFHETFLRCDVLESVTFEGEIGQNLNMNGCPKLSLTSLANIIDRLFDYTAEGNTASHILTLGSTNISKLTEEQQQIALDKGWTLA